MLNQMKSMGRVFCAGVLGVSCALVSLSSFADEPTRRPDTTIAVRSDGLHVQVVGASAAQLMDYLGVAPDANGQKTVTFETGETSYSFQCVKPAGRQAACNIRYQYLKARSIRPYLPFSASSSTVSDFSLNAANTGSGPDRFKSIWIAPEVVTEDEAWDGSVFLYKYNWYTRTWKSGDQRVSVKCSRRGSSPSDYCALNVDFKDFFQQGIQF